MRINIQFMVPGFSKCGTSTLCALLDEHPGICLPSNKEPHFFIDDNYAQNWDAYKALFPDNYRDLVCGDGTTMYSTLKHEKISRDRILRYFPEIKLIFLARDPLKRIESSFSEFHHSGVLFGINTEFNFDEALLQLPQLIDDSQYFSRLTTYREKIPQQRILIVFLEDLIADTETELRRCFNFLGVDPAPAATIRLRALNSRQEKLRDSKILRWLREHPYWKYQLAKLTFEQQNTLFKALGMRRSCAENIQWSAFAREKIAHGLADDIRRFLKLAGKQPDFWPHFSDLTKPFRRERARSMGDCEDLLRHPLLANSLAFNRSLDLEGFQHRKNDNAEQQQDR